MKYKIMKKLSTALILSVLAVATGCGKDNQTEPAESKTASTTTVAETTEVTTTSVTTTGKKIETTTVTETTTVVDTVDYSGLAGFWFIDGDPAAASFHITEDGKFTAYYANGIVENKGIVRRVFDSEINNYYYCMYLESGELYEAFADDGEKEKTDIYIGNGGFPHYVKLYGEGGLGDDGRGSEEAYTGTWDCERAHIEITYNGEGIFHATVKWGASASTYAQWEYPLIFVDGKLICDGNGTRSFVEYEEAGAEPKVTVEYTDGSAEFTLDGNIMKWNDLKEHSADDMIFRRNEY